MPTHARTHRPSCSRYACQIDQSTTTDARTVRVVDAHGVVRAVLPGQGEDDAVGPHAVVPAADLWGGGGVVLMLWWVVGYVESVNLCVVCCCIGYVESVNLCASARHHCKGGRQICVVECVLVSSKWCAPGHQSERSSVRRPIRQLHTNIHTHVPPGACSGVRRGVSLCRLSMRMKSFPMPWYLLNGSVGRATAVDGRRWGCGGAAWLMGVWFFGRRVISVGWG